MFLAIILGALVVGGWFYFDWIREPGNKSGDALRDCQNIPELPDGASKLTTKIIDGDTFLIEGGYSVRILGIDADERGHNCYEEAKERLEELILNKEVRLEKGKEDKDQWCRYLRYSFQGEENIGLTLVREGLAVARTSPENIKYREEVAQAEEEAREKKMGCKWGEVKGTEKEEPQEKGFSWKKLTPDSGSEVIGSCRAGKYIGQEVIVEGQIVDTHRSKTNTVFLNFEKAYPSQCFTAVIFSSNQYKFVEHPEDFYRGKKVRIRGDIKKYEGRAEIILEEPSQIEVGKK